MMNRLYRSEKDKVFEGVCGGLGEYFGIDPVIIRLIWVVLVIFGGTGILAYIIAIFIIPKKPIQETVTTGEERAVSTDNFSQRFWGVILVVAGILLLFGIIGPLASIFAGITLAMGHVLWPVLVIALGLYLYFKSSDTSPSGEGLKSIFPSDKKLFRLRSDRRIAGVCGGFGRYFNIDSNIIRVLWAVATLGSIGLGILAYAALAIYLPEDD